MGPLNSSVTESSGAETLPWAVMVLFLRTGSKDITEKEEEDEERARMLSAHVYNQRGRQAEDGSCLMAES